MARLKKRKDGRYQRKVTLSNGKQKFVYGKTIAEVNAAANALMNQDMYRRAAPRSRSSVRWRA